MSIAQYEENTRALFDAFRRNYGIIFVKVSIAWYDEIKGAKERRQVINEWCSPLRKDIYNKIIMDRNTISAQVESLLRTMGYNFDKFLQPNSMFIKRHVAKIFKDQLNCVKWPKQFAVICELVIDEHRNKAIRRIVHPAEYFLRAYMLTLNTGTGNYTSSICAQLPDRLLLPIITESMAKYLRGLYKSKM